MSIARPSTGSNGAATSPLTTAASASTAPGPADAPSGPTSEAPLTERELEKIEFYKTYDVMVGVRIAATLGGFFSLMIFMVIYKSKCRTGSKSITSDVVGTAAAMELDAVSDLPYDGAFCSPRISLGNMSAPAGTLRTRHSSSSFTNAMNYEQKSLPGSVMGWAGCGHAECNQYEWSEPQHYRQRASLDAAAGTSGNASYLSVPRVRLSSTCSSSDSSYYLEHRSLMELGLPPYNFEPYTRVECHAESDEEGGEASGTQHAPHNCAIDINVIHPTPDISPCTSERQLHRRRRRMMLTAPLASFGSSTLTEPDVEADARSIGSDSVFYNNDDYWTGSDDATLCDSCSEDDAGSEDSCSCCGASGEHSGAAAAPHLFTQQGPNVVQCSNEAAAAAPAVDNFTSSPRELSSHSNNTTEVASSLVLDQLDTNVVEENDELITETVF